MAHILTLYSHFKVCFGSALIITAGISLSPSSFAGTSEKAVTLFIAGDILPGRGVASRLKTGNTNLTTWQPQIRASDVAFCNLEAALPSPAQSSVRSSFPPKLWATQEGIKAISGAGFDIVSTANNHALDGGTAGWKRLETVLKNSKLTQVGSRWGSNDWKALNITVRGQKLSFLAASNWGPFQNGAAQVRSIKNSGLIEQVRDFTRQGNRVFVSLHWGEEHQSQPTDGQRQLAKRLIEAGAWAIIGHHSHVAGPIEIYRGRPIFYSLGNFVFDRMPQRQSGLVAMLRLTESGISYKTQIVNPETASTPRFFNKQTPKLPIPANEKQMGSITGHFLRNDAGLQKVVWSRVMSKVTSQGNRDRIRLLRLESGVWRVLAFGAHPQIRGIYKGDVDADGQEEVWLELQQRSKLDTTSRPRIHLYSATLGERGNYAFRARWRGSALSRPFTEWAVLPRSAKGCDIVALETNSAPLYRDFSWVAVYRWNGFGFRRLWESPVRGTVNNLAVSRDKLGFFAQFVQHKPAPRSLRLREKQNKTKDYFAAEVIPVSTKIK